MSWVQFLKPTRQKVRANICKSSSRFHIHSMEHTGESLEQKKGKRTKWFRWARCIPGILSMLCQKYEWTYLCLYAINSLLTALSLADICQIVPFSLVPWWKQTHLQWKSAPYFRNSYCSGGSSTPAPGSHIPCTQRVWDVLVCLEFHRFSPLSSWWGAW